MHTRAHTYTNQIFIDGELASFLSMGRNLPPLMQVVGASGAQEYWDLGAFSGQGALSVEAKLDDSMKRKASLPAAFPGASLLAPWPTCLQLWLRSPSSSPSCYSCQLLSFKAPWTSVQCVISLLHSPPMILLTAPRCPWLTKSLPGMAPLARSLSSYCRPHWHLPTSLHAVWALAEFRTPVHILLVYILFAGDKYTSPPKIRNKTEMSAHQFALEAL